MTVSRLSRCSADRLSGAFLLPLALVEVCEWRPLVGGISNHGEHRLDHEAAETLAAVFRDMPAAVSRTRLSDRCGEP